MNESILELRQLKKYYPIKGGVFKHHVADVKAVDMVDLSIRKGECLGLVGESGCGKTSLGKTLLRLHPATSGRIYFKQPENVIDDVERKLVSGDPKEIAEANRILKQVDITKMSARTCGGYAARYRSCFRTPPTRSTRGC
jgi:ABC-type oligopeptide transport system ATPase subunit